MLDALDHLERRNAPTDLPLRFCVQDVYRFDERRIIAGRIETGVLRVGDSLVFSPANKSSVVATIERWNAAPTEEAQAGDSIGITLREQIFVERGYVASHGTATPIETNRFHADVFWMAKEPLRLDAPYTIRSRDAGIEMAGSRHQPDHGFGYAKHHNRCATRSGAQ